MLLPQELGCRYLVNLPKVEIGKPGLSDDNLNGVW